MSTRQNQLENANISAEYGSNAQSVEKSLKRLKAHDAQIVLRNNLGRKKSCDLQNGTVKIRNHYQQSTALLEEINVPSNNIFGIRKVFDETVGSYCIEVFMIFLLKFIGKEISMNYKIRIQSVRGKSSSVDFYARRAVFYAVRSIAEPPIHLHETPARSTPHFEEIRIGPSWEIRLNQYFKTSDGQ